MPQITFSDKHRFLKEQMLQRKKKMLSEKQKPPAWYVIEPEILDSVETAKNLSTKGLLGFVYSKPR